MLLFVIDAKPKSRAMASRSNGKAAARQRAAAQRHHVHARAGLLQPLVIAREHFEIREQIVRPQHRLRAAQMRIAGNHRRGIALRAIEQRAHEPGEQFRARDRSRRAATAARRAIPARCGCVRCGSSPQARRPSRPACGSPACERLRRLRPRKNSGASARRRRAHRRPPPVARVPPPSRSPRFPAPARTPASPEYPRESGAGRNASDPEKRSNTSEGPSSNRPPQSFISAWPSSALLLCRFFSRRPHLHGQPDQVDEAARVLLIVLGAHREARDIQRVERIRRLAADRLESTLIQAQRDLAGVGLGGLGRRTRRAIRAAA